MDRGGEISRLRGFFLLYARLFTENVNVLCVKVPPISFLADQKGGVGNEKSYVISDSRAYSDIKSCVCKSDFRDYSILEF